jgi:hypothetical protein
MVELPKVRTETVLYRCEEKRVLERRFGLRPYEKERQERRSGAFRQNNKARAGLRGS